MSKAITFAAAIITILISGLVSCRPENKTSDVYNAPPPKVKSGETERGINEFDLEARKVLDLNDQLDFSDARPVRILIKTSCRHPGGDLIRRSEFPNPTTLRIFELLPEELLAKNLQTHPALCTLEFTLYNRAGSSRGMSLAMVSVEDAGAGLVLIRREPTATDEAPSVFSINSSSARGVRVRYQNFEAASVKLVCEDLSYLPLPFDQVFELDHFNLDFPEFRNGSDTDRILNHPVQNCRALVLQAGRTKAVSQAFTLTFPPLPVGIELIFSSFREPSHQIATENLTNNFRFPGAMPVIEWRVTNSVNVTRHLRLSAKPIGAKLTVITQDFSHQYQRSESLVSLVRPIVRPGDGGPARAEGELQLLTLPPRESLTVTLELRIPGILDCVGTERVGFTLTEIAPFVLEETDGKFVVLARHLIYPQPVFATPLAMDFIARLPLVRSRCSYP